MNPCYVCYVGPMVSDGYGGYECQNGDCGSFIRAEAIEALESLGVENWWYYMHGMVRSRS